MSAGAVPVESSIHASQTPWKVALGERSRAKTRKCIQCRVGKWNAVAVGLRQNCRVDIDDKVGENWQSDKAREDIRMGSSLQRFLSL